MSEHASVWRIVFMGTPPFAVPTLEALLAGPDHVVAVVTQPDRPAGRGQRVAASPVKERALASALPVLQPQALRERAVHAEIAGHEPDLAVVAAYGRILPPAILRIPRHGCINVHASLLPRHRGAAPIQWAIIAGDEATGVTIMQMNAAMDEGDILLQRREPIAATDTAATLGDRLARLGAAALMDAVRELKAGRLVPQPQDHGAATLAPLIRKEHGRIDWDEPAVLIERKVRALQPWPTAYTMLGGRLLKVLGARVAADAAASGTPGTVLGTGTDGIAVATGAGTLVITSVQLEGRRPLAAADLLRGRPVAPGTVLGS